MTESDIKHLASRRPPAKEQPTPPPGSAVGPASSEPAAPPAPGTAAGLPSGLEAGHRFKYLFSGSHPAPVRDPKQERTAATPAGTPPQGLASPPVNRLLSDLRLRSSTHTPNSGFTQVQDPTTSPVPEHAETESQLPVRVTKRENKQVRDLVVASESQPVLDPDSPLSNLRRPTRLRPVRTVCAVLAGGVLSGALFVLIGGSASPSSKDERSNGAAPAPESTTSNMGAELPVSSDSNQPAPTVAPSLSPGHLPPEGLSPASLGPAARTHETSGPSHHPASAPAATSTAPVSAPSPEPTVRSSNSATPEGTTLYVYRDEQLMPGQSWKTNRSTMIMQADGNLVLRDENGRALWHSGTVGTGYRAIMQADGNLVVYNKDNWGVWSTGTARHDGAVLCLQGDGNVAVVYQGQIIWSTGTQR